MEQYALLLTQNTATTGSVTFDEKRVVLKESSVLVGETADGGNPTALTAAAAEADLGKVLKLISNDAGGVKWAIAADDAGHTQHTDTGTTEETFILDSDDRKIKLHAESATKFGVKVNAGTYADMQVKDLIVNDLTVNGTNTIINSTTLTVDDKNIEIGSVDTPSDATADGGGITLKGTEDKTIIWDNAQKNWTLNQDVNVPTGKVYKINNVSILSATTVGTVTLANIVTAAANFTNNQLIIGAGANKTAKTLAAGSAGQILKMVGGTPVPTWSADTSFANPMSAEGDIIYGGTSGVATRLPKGTNGQVLKLVSGIPAWGADLTTHGNHTGDVTSVGLTTTIAAGAVTLAKMDNLLANSVIGNDTAGLLTPKAIGIGTNTVLGRVGANVVAAQLVNGQVATNTLALNKIVKVHHSRLIGTKFAGSGNLDLEPITLGDGLIMSDDGELSATNTTVGTVTGITGTAPVQVDVTEPAIPNVYLETATSISTGVQLDTHMQWVNNQSIIGENTITEGTNVPKMLTYNEANEVLWRRIGIDKLGAPVVAPATPTTEGHVGEMRYDDNFVYRCVSAGNWRRFPMSKWD